METIVKQKIKDSLSDNIAKEILTITKAHYIMQFHNVQRGFRDYF